MSVCSQLKSVSHFLKIKQLISATPPPTTYTHTLETALLAICMTIHLIIKSKTSTERRTWWPEVNNGSRPEVNTTMDKRSYTSPRTGPPDRCNRCGHEKKNFPASQCLAATRSVSYCKAGVRRIKEDTAAYSDTGECDVAKIELVNNLEMREKPSLMRVRISDQEFLWQSHTPTQKIVWDHGYVSVNMRSKKSFVNG